MSWSKQPMSARQNSISPYCQRSSGSKKHPRETVQPGVRIKSGSFRNTVSLIEGSRLFSDCSWRVSSPNLIFAASLSASVLLMEVRVLIHLAERCNRRTRGSTHPCTCLALLLTVDNYTTNITNRLLICSGVGYTFAGGGMAE